MEVCPVAVRIKKDPRVWSGIKENLNLEFCFFFKGKCKVISII